MEYEINEGTLAVIATDDFKTKIMEDDKEYIVDNTPYNIMDYSCKYFGSSYEGRKEGTKAILNIDYKVPIVIENSKNIIFFPTNSPSAKDCCWISLKNISNYVEKDYNSTEIVFDNGKKIILPVSKRTIENQILRASRLDLVMRNRKIDKNSI